MRQRTQKNIAARIDRTYFQRPHRWRRFRLSMVLLATAAAILFVVLTAVGGKGELIHNPGRLASVHATFQNDCAKCHDGCDETGKPTGKFSKAVSDSACLKCHDAGIHHPNSATMITMDKTRNPPVARSSNCASCHMEHRGQAALVSTSDLLCVQCHVNLGEGNRTFKTPAAEVPLKATAFNIDDHPHFGRSLMVGGKAVDPTVVRFNHKKHITGDPASKTAPAIDDKHADMRNCTFCHDPSPAAAASMTWETGKSAFEIPGSEPGKSPETLIDGSGEHRSMTQVNYVKDCKVCHDLGTLPGTDMAIPHGDMNEVRKVILSWVADDSIPWQKFKDYSDTPGAKEKPVNDRVGAKVTDGVDDKLSKDMDALTAAVKAHPLSVAALLNDPNAKLDAATADKLAAAAIKLPTNIVAAVDRTKVAAAVSATTQPSQHLRALLLARLRDEATKGLTGDEKANVAAKVDAALSRYNQDTPDPRWLEVYVAYNNAQGVSCVKCHDMEGDLKAVPPEWADLARGGLAADPKAKDASPVVLATPQTLFRSVPTGIPAGPRRWFVNSTFNHDAHRRMSCVECHSSALTSEKTSDVLSPDIEWKDTNGATRSCMECHHPDNSDGPGAASNCTECHTYHDRSHERLIVPSESTAPGAVSVAK